MTRRTKGKLRKLRNKDHLRQARRNFRRGRNMNERQRHIFRRFIMGPYPKVP